MKIENGSDMQPDKKPQNSILYYDKAYQNNEAENISHAIHFSDSKENYTTDSRMKMHSKKCCVRGRICFHSD
jgi:hypothetical protein